MPQLVLEESISKEKYISERNSPVIMPSLVKRVRMKVYDSLVCFLRIQKKPYDVQKKIFIQILLNLVFIVMSGMVTVANFVVWLQLGQEFHYPTPFVFCTTFLILLAFLVLPKSAFVLHVHVFSLCASLFIGTSVAMFYDYFSYGILSSPLGVNNVVVLVVLGVSNLYMVGIFMFLVFVTIVISIVKDVIFLDISVFCTDHPAPTDKLGVLMVLYVSAVVPLIVAFIVIIRYKLSSIKVNELIKQLGSGILSLKFEEKEFKKFLQKGLQKKYMSDLEILFDGIIKNLQLYRNYLPDSIKFRNEKIYSAGNNSRTSTSVSVVSRNSKPLLKSDIQSFESTNSLQSNDLHSDHGSTGSNNSESDFKISKKVPKHKPSTVISINYGLNERKVVFGMIKIKKFYHFMKKYGKRKTEKIIMKFMNCSAEVLNEKNGIINEIHGSKLYFSFNAVCISMNSERKAIESVLMIKKRMENIMEDIEIVSVISKENLVCGNVCSNHHSKFVLLSPTIHYLEIISSIVKNASVIIDDEMEIVSKYSYKVKLIEIVKLKSMNKTMRLYKVIEKMDISDKNEWLYDIKESLEEDDVVKMLYIDSWACLEKGDFSGAQSFVSNYLSKKMGDVDALKLLEKIKRKEIGKVLCLE